MSSMKTARVAGVPAVVRVPGSTAVQTLHIYTKSNTSARVQIAQQQQPVPNNNKNTLSPFNDLPATLRTRSERTRRLRSSYVTWVTRPPPQAHRWLRGVGTLPQPSPPVQHTGSASSLSSGAQPCLSSRSARVPGGNGSNDRTISSGL